MDAKKKKKLYEYYKKAGYKLKVYDYPIVYTAGGKRHLREFDIEELLFRKPLIVSDENTNAYYKDKVVLLTGGGGSIGKFPVVAGQINKEFKKDRRCGVIVLPLPDVRERGCIAEKSPYLRSFLLFEKLNRVCHALLLKGWSVSVMLYSDLTIARFYI